MSIEAQIEAYIAALPEPKRSDMHELHRLVLGTAPDCRLWFLDGTDAAGKTVSNPNIGYGVRTMNLARGKTRDFYRIGLSANSTGISVYIMGVDDKAYLKETYGATLGKASITGYCIRFRTIAQIDMQVFGDIVRFGFQDR